MKILLSNDDGYNSEGLSVLENSLKNFGSVIVSAPKNNVSACSSSLSVHSDVGIKKTDNNHYIIDGTPADCVHIATRGILKKMPDIVFCGINFGSNLGEDVIYSGTVGAAIEGRFCKYAPVAISVTSTRFLPGKCICYFNSMSELLETCNLICLIVQEIYLLT